MMPRAEVRPELSICVDVSEKFKKLTVGWTDAGDSHACGGSITNSTPVSPAYFRGISSSNEVEVKALQWISEHGSYCLGSCGMAKCHFQTYVERS